MDLCSLAVAAPALNFAGAPPWVGSYYAPSASNVPTILVGDRFFVELGYYRDHAVKRGEMIVFVSPVDGRTVFVKRAVGLPGDKVQLRGGDLYINGEEAPRRRIEDYPYRFGDTTIAMHQYIEKLSGDALYRILKVPSGGQLDDTPVYDIPAGHYFTLGDNRDNSVDSRMPSQIGYVPAANLIGRAYIVYWPLARLGHKLN
jgi:signal peptidase I